jgi:hypothetical protein
MLPLASGRRHLEMEAAVSCETIVPYHITRRHIQEDGEDVEIKQRPLP